MSNAPAPSSRWNIRWGFLHRAHAIWNCLACHLVVDDGQSNLTITLAIPSTFTLAITCPPIPGRKIMVWLAGGKNECAEYGFWHDYDVTKLQWRRIIDLDGDRAGWEWRKPHAPHKPTVTRKETVISHLVAGCGEYWIRKENIDSWRLTLTSWRASSDHWWIPSLYDHSFMLNITVDGENKDASLKLQDPKQMSPKDIFMALTKKLDRPVVCR